MASTAAVRMVRDEGQPPNNAAPVKNHKQKSATRKVVGKSYTFGDYAACAIGDGASATHNHYAPPSGAGTAQGNGQGQPPNNNAAPARKKRNQDAPEEEEGTTITYNYGNYAAHAEGTNARATHNHYAPPSGGGGGQVLVGVVTAAVGVTALAVVYMMLTRQKQADQTIYFGDVTNNNRAMLDSPSVNVNLPSLPLPDVSGWVKRWFTGTRAPSVV